MTVEDAVTLRYVLSAGRTGTVFLENLINRRLDGVNAAHEPDETRYLMMLANLRNDWGIGGSMLGLGFKRSRARRIKEIPGVYVEINPFLCSLTDLLPEPGHELRILHMVRDPADWAGSITTFKASSRFRDIIDYVPFAKPYPSPRPPGWGGLGSFERALWRWNWCNSRIEALRPAAKSYALVRYEDLFAPQEDVRNSALAAIASTLDLPGPLEASRSELEVSVNPSAGPGPNIDRQAAARICGNLARAYGYDY